MTPQTKTIVLSAACAALVVSSVYQQWEIGKLREENDTLRQSTAARASARKPTRTRDAAEPSRTPPGGTAEYPAAAEDGYANPARAVRPPPLTASALGDAVAYEGFTRAEAEPHEDSFIGVMRTGFIASGSEGAVLRQPMVAGKVHWDHGQATGAPDTAQAGDLPTAWAPRNPRSGEQWLALGYQNPVEISEINIHETHSPGAISKVTVLLPDGSEKTLWSGVAKVGAPDEILETTLPVPPGITGNQIKIYVDTNRVQSWPEIDAVELVGTNGLRQWASSSTASSSYSETYRPAEAPQPGP